MVEDLPNLKINCPTETLVQMPDRHTSTTQSGVGSYLLTISLCLKLVYSHLKYLCLNTNCTHRAIVLSFLFFSCFSKFFFHFFHLNLDGKPPKLTLPKTLTSLLSVYISIIFCPLKLYVTY